jgi:hypothetical protein
MANVITTLLKMDSTQFRTGMKAAQQSIRETDGVVNKAKAGWASAFAGFASSPVVIAGATAAIGTFAAQSVSAASNLEESVNAVNVVFGESADKILEFGENAARSVGLANSEFNQLATPLGSILKNTGLEMDAVANKTIELSTRAADMASVFGGSVGDALGAIQAGLRGELDPLERFGVKLSAATVEARALADTGKESAKQLTEQEKALARIDIILEQTNQTAGDFSATSGDLANQTRILKAEFENLQAAAGKVLVPVLSDVADILLAIGDAAEFAKNKINEIPGGGSFLEDLFSGIPDIADEALFRLRELEEGLGFEVIRPQENIGALRAEFNALVAAGKETVPVVDNLGNAVEGLDSKTKAYGVTAEGTNRAIDRMAWPKLAEGARVAATEIEDLGEAAEDAATPFEILANAVNAVKEAMDEAFSDLDDDLEQLERLSDIEEQFTRIAEAETMKDAQTEIRRLIGLVADYVQGLEDIPPEKVSEILTVLRSGDVEAIRTLLDELTQDRFINIGINPPQNAFDSANAVFAPGIAPSAPTFQGLQTAIPSGPMTVYNYFPVGSTPTTTNQDLQTYYNRNGVR